MVFASFISYIFLSLFIYCLIKWLFFNKTKMLYKNTTKNEHIIEKLHPLDFKPTFWLPEFYTQILYNELKKKPEIKYRREYLTNDDGGILSLDWVVKENDSYSKLLVILHGLTGGSNTC